MKLKYLLSLFALIAMSAQNFTSAQMRTADQEPYIPGQLIVQIDRDFDLEKAISSLPEVYQFDIVQELSPFMRAWLLQFNPYQISQMDALALIRKMEGVSLVQNNHLVEIRSTIPDDTQFNQQWHHFNDGSGGGTADADIDTDEAWSITTGGVNALGHDIVVCILEGVDFTHNDLVDNHWSNPNEIPGNGIDDDNNGYIDDINGWNVSSNSGNLSGASTGHGTNVAGMIGAVGNNEMGVAGANWSVKMMNVIGYSINNEASVVAAYNYPLTLRKKYNDSNGQEGAFVVSTNASWGIDGANPNNYPIWCNFYDTLGVYGILNCGATTNSNLNVDVAGDMPTACPSPYMVGVGRSDRNDNFAGGYGATTINFAAPGINVRTTSNGNNYTTTTGTSFASPLTAGVIALLYSIPCETFMQTVLADPQLGADLVLNSLMDGVDQKPQLLDYFVAGGRINVKNSMDLLMADNCSSCATPAQLTTSDVVETSASIGFNLVNDATSYTFFYRPLGAADWIEMSVDNSPVNLTGLMPCTDYEYFINAICPEENSSNSQVMVFKTKGCGACLDLEYCETSTSADPSARFSVLEPSTISSTVTNFTVTSGWGGSVTSGYVYGDLVLVNDGTASPTLACAALTNGAEISGKIAVAQRGSCNFTAKALNAQNAGAIALVLINDQGTAPNQLGASTGSGDVTIPVVMISQSQGAALLAELQAGGRPKGLLGAQNEYIQSFSFMGETFTTGDNNGYFGPTESNIELTAGVWHSFTMIPGFSGQPLPEYTRIWVDANQNGEFESNELAYDQGQPSEGNVEGLFFVPGDAEVGESRLRVQMVYQGGDAGNLPDNCGTFQSGETEDYCVSIKIGSASLNEQELYQVSLYPNPSTGIVNVSANFSEASSVQILSLSGQVVGSYKMANGSLQMNLDHLSEGVYVIQTLGKDGVVLNAQKLVLNN